MFIGYSFGMRKLVIALLFLALLPIQATATTTPKAGAACSKLGQARVINDVSYKCKKASKAQLRKSKSKFVWSKGIQLAQSQPTPVTPAVPELPATPKTAISPSADLIPVDRCRIAHNPAGNDFIRAGFPQHPVMVRSGNKVVVQMIYVDFPDLTDSAPPSADMPFWEKNVAEFFSAMSGNKLKFEWRYANKYFRLSKPVKDYGILRSIMVESGSGRNLIDFLQEAVAVADSEVDFSEVNFVVALPPPNVSMSQMDVSPAMSWPLEQPLATNEGRVHHGTMIAADARRGDGYLTLIHEFGHLLGLHDYYWHGWRQTMPFEEQFKFTGQFDSMSYATGPSKEWLAWSRWLTDFLPSSQVRCIDGSKTTTHQLTTIATNTDDPQLLVIPTGTNTGIAVESRRSIRYDSAASKSSEGLLVYQIDTRISTGQGSVQLVKKPTVKERFFADAPLKPGESVTVAGYTITNLEAGKLWDVAEVKKN